MREILFKAKRKDDGKWFKGDYQRRYDSFGKIEHLIFHGKDAIVWEYAEIDLDTLCQHTGLTAYWDDEEASVWEHDLVAVDYRGKTVIAEVKYECGMFILTSDEFVDSYIPLFDVVQVEDIGWVDAKVIGNVFDNPELLEKARQAKMSNIYTEGNEDNLEKAVAGLDQFTKNWCMNCKGTEENGEPIFRCEGCAFKTESHDCLIKGFVKRELGEIPFDFGAMGR